MTPAEIESIEVDLVIDAILKRWGYDFRHYARASFKRRLLAAVGRAGLERVSDLVPRVVADERFFGDLLGELTIPVTEMFRDPSFFTFVREAILPVLRTWPFARVWHAGCATGEEVYSLAILLEEEGFYDRVRIFATDVIPANLGRAREGIYPLENVRAWSGNYHQAGGRGSLSDWYHASYESAKMKDSLRRNVTFAQHNLATDAAFSEMHLILCRNVLIYFDQTLQDRVLELFHGSLCHRGYLCLGPKETIDFSGVANLFETVDGRRRVYRKIGAGAASMVVGPALEAD